MPKLIRKISIHWLFCAVADKNTWLLEQISTVYGHNSDSLLVTRCRAHLWAFWRHQTSSHTIIGIFSSEAILYLRKMWPKSIENMEQTKLATWLFQFLYSKAADSVEAKGETKRTKSCSISSFRLITMCCFPGSGKSTFCDLFLTSGINVTIVNKDNVGRKECGKNCLKVIKTSDLVILYRTNITRNERQ